MTAKPSYPCHCARRGCRDSFCAVPPSASFRVKMSSSLIFSATEDDFLQSVIEASHIQPVLVDFWADWCAPCHALAPVLEKVAHAFAGAVRLAKVEVDDNMRLAGRYSLRGFPTVILFSRGEERGRFSGAQPEQFVRSFIEGCLA